MYVIDLLVVNNRLAAVVRVTVVTQCLGIYIYYITCPQPLAVILFFNKYLVDDERTSSASSRVATQSRRSHISLMTGVKSNISDLTTSLMMVNSLRSCMQLVA